MPKENTGFENFFNSMNGKYNITDNIDELTKTLEKMEKDFDKASSLPKALNDQFYTKEAIETGKSLQRKSTKKSEDQEKPEKLNIILPENKNPETFGFKGVAGMKELQQNLRDNFIAPLKFKFMMEGLKKESPLSQPFPPGEKGAGKKELYSKLYEVYKKFKVGIPTGMLFYGPPGTGKTFITKKLAEELGAGMIKKSVGEFGSSYIHATTKNIKEFFDSAKKASEKGPIILFLDEIDSLVSKRTDNVDSNKAEEVSQFLQEFNALEDAPNLIVIAATNRPDHLDSALLRSGRLDKKIYIGPPDFDARAELFQIYIEKIKRPHDKLDYKELAKLTEDYVAADIEAICDEVSRDSSKNIIDMISLIDSGDVNHSNIEDKLDDHYINMELLKQAIKDMPSSLKHVDMSIYEKFGV